MNAINNNIGFTATKKQQAKFKNSNPNAEFAAKTALTAGIGAAAGVGLAAMQDIKGRKRELFNPLRKSEYIKRAVSYAGIAIMIGTVGSAVIRGGIALKNKFFPAKEDKQVK